MDNTPISVLVCGNFGFRKNQIDGQTMKTRILKEAFAEVLGVANVRMADSSFLPRSPIRFLTEIRNGFKECTDVVIMPGCRGLQLFLPLFLYWKKVFGRQVRYIVVGGWLPDLLSRKVWLCKLCQKLDGIYVETDSMRIKLSDLGMSRVSVLPNSRKFDLSLVRQYAPTGCPIKLVYYSRILPAKGIELAAAAVARINDNPAMLVRAILDVYGPIADDYRADFQALLASSPNIRYRGVLTGDPYSVLQQYDLMVFPTYYEGEGFPGAIVDALVAGLPVIASDWKYNREIVDEGKTGMICKAQSIEDLASKVEECITKPTLIAEMRKHCIERAKGLHVDHSIACLLKDMAVPVDSA